RLHPKNFSRQLGALGQAIKKFGFSALELEIRSRAYLVIAEASPGRCKKFSFSRFVSELVRRPSLSPSLATPVAAKSIYIFYQRTSNTSTCAEKVAARIPAVCRTHTLSLSCCAALVMNCHLEFLAC